jgi:hypothetical protein
MQLRLRWIACLTVALVIAGCGSTRTEPDRKINSAAANGPHGGPALPLPHHKGYAEIVIERGVKKKDPSRFAIYFLASDLKAPLSPLPAEVRATLVSNEGESSLTFSPDPKPKDPAGPGRFSSPTGAYDSDEYTGELSAVLDGESFSRPFALR